MELTGEAKLLRIFVGEADQHKHLSLYECIVKEARSSGLAGATAWRGAMSYGAASRIRSTKIMDLSSDLPMIVEIVDTAEKIDAFLPRLHTLFEESQCGGLVTLEKVQIIKYLHGGK